MSLRGDKKQILDKIKSLPYWEVNIRPKEFIRNRIQRKELKDIVRSAVIELRGWDYPHFHDRDGDPYPIAQGPMRGIEQTIDWWNHIEVWRMTQSGNFLHLLALREARERDYEHMAVWEAEKLKGKQWLGVLGTLYTITEIYEFARRLAKKEVFDDSAVIDIKLHQINGMVLAVDSPDRVPLRERVCRVDGPWQPPTIEFPTTELLNRGPEIALESFRDLVYLFGWENPPDSLLKSDQEKFLAGKL